jgi:hypothetical protein
VQRSCQAGSIHDRACGLVERYSWFVEGGCGTYVDGACSNGSFDFKSESNPCVLYDKKPRLSHTHGSASGADNIILILEAPPSGRSIPVGFDLGSSFERALPTRVLGHSV